MAERIQYEKAYQVRMGRAPAGETDTLPESDVRFQELGVTRAAPKQTDEPGGAAEEEDSHLEVFQDAASQLKSSDDSDEDTRRGRSREERLFLAAEDKRARPRTPAAISRRTAADRITIDESKGPIHLAAEFWINPKTGNYRCPVAVCGGRGGGPVEYGQWRSLVRHFEVCHNDPSFMFFCNGRDCVFSEARPDKVLSHRSRMGCTGDVKVQVLLRVRIPTRVELPTVVPVVFEPQLMPSRPKASGSVRAGPKSALRQGTGVAKATVRQGGAVRFCLQEPPRAAASGPVTTRAPSTSEPSKRVNTGASAGCLTAPRVQAAPFDMRSAGIGRGGCRPKTSSVVEGRPGATVVHKKPTKERAIQTEDDECLECGVRESYRTQPAPLQVRALLLFPSQRRIS